MSENTMDAVDRRLRAVAVSAVTDAYVDDWAAVDAIMAVDRAGWHAGRGVPMIYI